MKLFTPVEANALLPEIIPKLESIRRLYATIEKASAGARSAASASEFGGGMEGGTGYVKALYEVGKLTTEIAEMGVEIMLKATKVDGIYSADPVKDPTATLYKTITFDEALIKNLQVMDATAFALCRDRKLPIKVFSILKPGALMRVVRGEPEGTLVHV